MLKENNRAKGTFYVHQEPVSFRSRLIATIARLMDLKGKFAKNIKEKKLTVEAMILSRLLSLGTILILKPKGYWVEIFFI